MEPSTSVTALKLGVLSAPTSTHGWMIQSHVSNEKTGSTDPLIPADADNAERPGVLVGGEQVETKEGELAEALHLDITGCHREEVHSPGHGV